MGKYTILDDPKADVTVQEVLDMVCDSVRRVVGKDLQAIILVGGYGRGEGGIYKVLDNYNLVNDLDLLVFFRGSLKRAKKRFDSSLMELSRQLLHSGQGLKEIDIELTNVQRFKFFVPRTVGYYEIANGHQLIYGNLDLGKVMPKIDPKSLAAYEGTNYFRNRGSGLLIPALYFLTDGLKDPVKRKNFQIELHKACQAMGDAFLLMNGQYHFSYQERLKRFRQLKSNNTTAIPADLFEGIAPLYEWGMSNKLTPCFDWPGDQEMIDKWFEIKRVFSDFFLWYESERLRHKFSGWIDYAEYIERNGADEPFDLKCRSFLWSAKWFMQKRNKGENIISYIHRTRSILKIMPLLLFSLTSNLQVKPYCVKKAAFIMGYSMTNIDLTLWKKMVQEFLITNYPTDVVKEAVVPFKEYEKSILA